MAHSWRAAAGIALSQSEGLTPWFFFVAWKF
jgi:hypothetical protein